jgi:hypothetical protein
VEKADCHSANGGATISMQSETCGEWGLSVAPSRVFQESGGRCCVYIECVWSLTTDPARSPLPRPCGGRVDFSTKSSPTSSLRFSKCSSQVAGGSRPSSRKESSDGKILKFFSFLSWLDRPPPHVLGLMTHHTTLIRCNHFHTHFHHLNSVMVTNEYGYCLRVNLLWR